VLLAAGGLELAGRVTGRPPPLTMNGVRFFSQHRVVSTRKAREELGWAPLLDVADGARRTVDWYRAQGWI
jgi:nucleoside-diphosphate-sugar epimerase